MFSSVTANISSLNSLNKELLFQAIADGNLENTRNYLNAIQNNPDALLEINDKSETAFELAIRSHKPDVLRALLSACPVEDRYLEKLIYLEKLLSDYMKNFTGGYDSRSANQDYYSDYRSQAIIHEYIKRLTTLISFQKNDHLDINQADAKLLMKVSLNRFNLLKTTVDNLREFKKLNSSSFSKAVNKITQKLPVAAPAEHTAEKLPSGSYLHKLDTGESWYTRSTFWFPEVSGGEANVNPGYADESGDKIKYCIKELHIYKDQKTTQDITARGVTYARLLGRHAGWYQPFDGNPYKRPIDVTEWVEGVTLLKLDKRESKGEKSELYKYPLERRLKWLISLISKVEIFHSNNQVHGDINDKNVILNLEKDDLTLIDFGNSRRSHSKHRDLATNRGFYPDSEKSYYKESFASDMLGLSYVVGELFPEFCKLERKDPYEYGYHDPRWYIKRLDTDANNSVISDAIWNLIKNMQSKQTQRCTSKRALEYCKALLPHFTKGLNIEELKDILNATIHDKIITEEDIIREYFGYDYKSSRHYI